MISRIHIVFWITVLFMFSQSGVRAATKERSDTMDIVHTTINLSVDQTAETIQGYAELQLVSKMNNIGFVLFDLLQLQVDSIRINQEPASFTYDSLTLRVNFNTLLNTADSAAVRIYYKGNPKSDPSWGGFYFSGQYAYNMGVGFTSIPHNFGRCWFPCFDNFVERCTFTIICTTTTERTVAANGMLLSVVNNGNGTRTFTWQMNQSIPSYLTCIAINSYTLLQKSFSGINGAVPVSLYCLPEDTNQINNSFIHLEDAFDFFEDKFGAYSWDKIGYVLVPFMAGAMEHSTMISYPVAAVDGSTSSEDIMVHELSHQWFGDLVTCETAQDMWLNEGWADYCARLFIQHYYGESSFISDYLANHEQVIRFSRYVDGGLYAVSNVPDQVTYGATSYNRGADVAHTLRAYMGDALFFDCLKSYLNQYKFQAASSVTLRDHLSQCSGINLNDFFDDWVFNPGFATFSIDSFSVLNSSAPYQVQVFLRQKLNESDHYFNNVPLEITVLNNQWQRDVQKVMMSGPCAQVIINTNLNPQLLLLDEANRLSDASNGETRVIKQTGNANFSYGRMNLLISGITDSALLRIDHYYASPDRIKPEIDNLFISDYHYWRVSGIDLQKLQAKATVQYNGTTSTSQGYLDHTLITNSEDSLVLMYRPSSRYQWRVENDVLFTRGNVNDKKGSFTINQLKGGEYALAVYQANKTPDYTDTPDSCALFTSILSPKSTAVPLLMLIPTLTNTQLTTRVICENPAVLTIVNSDGITMQTRQVSAGAHYYHTDVSQWTPGNYYVMVTDKSGRTTKKFIVIK